VHRTAATYSTGTQVQRAGLVSKTAVQQVKTFSGQDLKKVNVPANKLTDAKLIGQSQKSKLLNKQLDPNLTNLTVSWS
jgi:hypothetical protein